MTNDLVLSCFCLSQTSRLNSQEEIFLTRSLDDSALFKVFSVMMDLVLCPSVSSPDFILGCGRLSVAHRDLRCFTAAGPLSSAHVLVYPLINPLR